MEYLLKLFDLYKDNATWKSIKELLLSEDQEQQKKWQEFAKQLYILCLEETVIQYDWSQSMEDFTTWDMNDTDFERVKSKMDQALSWKGFNEIYREYKESSVAQVWALSLRKVEKWESQVHEQVNKITDEIIQTLNDIDWAWKRKNPKFEAATEQPNEWEIKWTFNSWWYKEEITIYTKDWKLSWMKIDGLDQRYPYKENNLLNQSRNENDIKESVKEGLRTANLINFIKKNIEENPYWAGASWKRWNAKYWKYHWSNWGDLERDITNNFNDIDIVECETLEKYYPMIHKDEEFLDYINHLL